MRKGVIWILVIIMLFSTACGESLQKAPDYIMEGYDGDVSYRVWDTNLFFERMQEKTGITFQYVQFTDYGKWTERKKELMTGENLPDVLFKAELNASEVRNLYQGGQIIDLTPYLEQYAPDLWQLFEEHPEWKKAVSMPDGAIPALPAINTLQNNDAMWINTAWLKKLKLEKPTTAEELTEVLRAFRTGDPNGNYQQDEIPMTFVGMWELRFLGHAFGILDNDYYVREKDGKVSSSLTTPENRAFLAWLHQLWEEGLLDQNGFSSTDTIRQITDEKKAIPYGLLLSTTPLTILPQNALEQFEILEPMTFNGEPLVLGVEKEGVNSPNYFYSYKIKVPNGFAELKPEELDGEYFCSALYTLAAQYELGGIVPVRIEGEGKTRTVETLRAYLAKLLDNHSQK